MYGDEDGESNDTEHSKEDKEIEQLEKELALKKKLRDESKLHVEREEEEESPKKKSKADSKAVDLAAVTKPSKKGKVDDKATPATVDAAEGERIKDVEIIDVQCLFSYPPIQRWINPASRKERSRRVAK